MIYKILLTYICCAFVGLGNKLYTMHGTNIKMIQCSVYQYFTLSVNIGITLA